MVPLIADSQRQLQEPDDRVCAVRLGQGLCELADEVVFQRVLIWDGQDLGLNLVLGHPFGPHVIKKIAFSVLDQIHLSSTVH